MPSPGKAIVNVGGKALRRLMTMHKPLVRQARRRARASQHADMRQQVIAIEREIAAVCASGRPIVAGPWLGEVGYEVLYWIPFLRWVRDRYQVPRERMVALSRGGFEHLYSEVAGGYTDMFDLQSPAELAARNDARQQTEEGGGRKQSGAGALDHELIAAACGAGADVAVLHPSLMFRLFRESWQGNLPLDVLWTHTEYTLPPRPERPSFPGLPARFVAAKFYTGPALPDTPETRRRLRGLVAAAARALPVVVLDTGLAVDDHSDYLFADLPNVISARDWLTPRTNLGVQTAVIAHADYFVGTCGGLAWLAPFLGVPAVAVYGDDRFLAPHLLVARQAGRRVGAAEFTTLDLRAFSRFVPDIN